MNKKDIHLLEEAYESQWGGKGAYQKPDNADEYGPFPLNPQEQNVVDAYIGRTKLVELLRDLKRDKPDLFNAIMEEIVLKNIKSPTGL